MNKQPLVKIFNFVIFTIFYLAASRNLFAGAPDINITIHLRGVYESNLSLVLLSGGNQFRTVAEAKGVKSGEIVTIKVPGDNLPGEFILRFDYREKQTSTPYLSEKYIFIHNQDLELWVSPVHCNIPDSTWFQKEERENTAFALFTKENGRQKEKPGLLQQFLMNYDDTKSIFYEQGIEEYEKRRQAYNQWLDNRVKTDRLLFVSSLYRFDYIPPVDWEGSEKDRMLSMISHYFDGIDFNDPVITRTSQLNEWMNSYVNLHFQLAATVALRDSLIAAAARTAVEKARLGNPVVYGWMVDYFYRGFESNNIPEGMKVLEPYLNDPDCLTSKRMEIERRLKGMEALAPGTKAPDIMLNASDDSPFQLYSFHPATKYVLLVFWSADCSHCTETIDAVYPWQQKPATLQKVSVVTISLDQSDAGTKIWVQKIKELPGWKHLKAEAGVNSKVANDYFVLATPVMILLDTKTKEIISMPESALKLKQSIP